MPGGTDLKSWLRRSYVGPIVIAVVLYAGLKAFVGAVENPAAALASRVLDFAVQSTSLPLAWRPSVTTLGFGWDVTALNLLYGLIIGGAALWFARWLYTAPPATSEARE